MRVSEYWVYELSPACVCLFPGRDRFLGHASAWILGLWAFSCMRVPLSRPWPLSRSPVCASSNRVALLNQPSDCLVWNRPSFRTSSATKNLIDKKTPSLITESSGLLIRKGVFVINLFTYHAIAVPVDHKRIEPMVGHYWHGEASFFSFFNSDLAVAVLINKRNIVSWVFFCF